MNTTEFANQLKAFIVQELLDGKEAGIDGSTPLLKWGVIDSLSLVKVLSFIDERFGIDVPPAEVDAANFENLTAIARLLTRLSAPPTKTSSFVRHGDEAQVDDAAGAERRR